MNHRSQQSTYTDTVYSPYMAIGITMVSSASIYFADENYGDPFHFASRQMLFISIGLIVNDNFFCHLFRFFI